MPSITNLATTTTALTAVENKIPDHSKYITTPDKLKKFIKLTAEKFCSKISTSEFSKQKWYC